MRRGLAPSEPATRSQPNADAAGAPPGVRPPLTTSPPEFTAVLPLIDQLRAAIDSAIQSGDMARVLRLLVVNLPRYPAVPSLRWGVATVALSEGRRDEAVAVLRTLARLETEAGDLIGSVAALRMLGNLGDAAPDLWSALFAAVERRGFATEPIPATAQTSAPDLVADKPALPLDALIAVAREMALREPIADVHRRERFSPVTLLSSLPSEQLRGVFAAAHLVPRSPGQPLLGPPDVALAWVAGGCVARPDGPRALVPGTLILPDSAVPVAGTGVRLVTLDEAAVADLRASAEGARAFDAVVRRQRLLRAIASSDFASRVSPETLRRLLGLSVLLHCGRNPLHAPGRVTAGLMMVVDGNVKISRTDGPLRLAVAQLSSGGVFGESSVAPSLPELLTAEPTPGTDVLLFPAAACAQLHETDPAARKWLDEQSQLRLASPGLLDTAQGILIDETGH